MEEIARAGNYFCGSALILVALLMVIIRVNAGRAGREARQAESVAPISEQVYYSEPRESEPGAVQGSNRGAKWQNYCRVARASEDGSNFWQVAPPVGDTQPVRVSR